MITRLLEIKKAILLSVIGLAFFEFFLYTNNNFGLQPFSSSSGWWIFFDLLFIFFCFVWLVTTRKGKDHLAVRFLLPLSINISLLVFLLFSPVTIVSHVAAVLVSLIFLLSLAVIERDKGRLYMANAVYFLSLFLFFAGMYGMIDLLPKFYWLSGIFSVIFVFILLYPEIESMMSSKNRRLFFLLLFSVVILELFIVSLMWPIQSTFIKSIILVLFYYLCWGFFYKYSKEPLTKREMMRYAIVSAALLVLVALAALLRGQIL